MDKDLKNLLSSTDFSKIKGLKETHINILNAIRDSLINNKQLYEQRWLDVYNKNFITKKDYGILNSINLSIISEYKKYKSSEWMTFAQMKKINQNLKQKIKLKKGSIGAKVIFWSIYNRLEKKNITEKEFLDIPLEKRTEMLEKGDLYFYNKEATVFNLDCFENIPMGLKIPNKLPNYEEIDINLIKLLSDEMNLKVYFREQNQAFYDFKDDSITLPSEKQWKDNNSFKATFFHELSHATMHKNRLNRINNDSKPNANIENYSIEEIIAEMSSAFLSNKFNYKTEYNINSTAEYLDSYAKILIENPKEILNAISKASMVSNYIENIYEKVQIKEKENEMNNIKELPDFSKEPDIFKYQLLGRLQMDCEYYLGYGDRDESKLWAKNVDRQIEIMKNIYESIDEKPEWINLEEIEKLKFEMNKEKSDFWIIEYNETDQEIKQFANEVVTSDLIDKIESYDKQFCLKEEGIYKFYFDHIVNNKTVEHIRIDIGVNDLENKEFFNYLRDNIDKKSVLENKEEPGKVKKQKGLER